MDLNPIVETGIFIVILIFSVIFHEVAHGLMAFRLGDPTAKFAGRLTLNPIPHIDLFGSLILPALLYYAGLPILGAAKPVPVDYRNLGNIRRDMILVSVVGPLTNLLLAAVAAAVYRLTPGISGTGEILLVMTVQLNVVLALFNMIPIPPLDGSKILASILGYIDHNLMYRFLDLERFGFVLVLLLVMIPGLFSSILLPPLLAIMGFLLGQPISF
jgi:Zn-dependent protease